MYLVQGSSQVRNGPALVENLAVNGDEVAILEFLHIHKRRQDEAAAVAVFTIDRGVAHYPDAAAGMDIGELASDMAIFPDLADAAEVRLRDLHGLRSSYLM